MTPPDERDLYPGDLICSATDLAPGETLLRTLVIDEHEQSLILVHTEEGFRAYLNRCRHVPVTLDWGDGDVLDETGTQFLCHTHGARYRLEDGRCVVGPCVGRNLIPVKIEEREGSIYLADQDPIGKPDDIWS